MTEQNIDSELERAWEDHIRVFFTARLPGNESNFNFTEILANFPFMLEWVIQNQPEKPYTESIPAELIDWSWSRWSYHQINGYDTKFISAHPRLTPDIVLQYPDFPWDKHVLKRRFESEPESLARLASLIPDDIQPIDDTVYNSIINFQVSPGISIIDNPDETTDIVYIPKLLALDFATPSEFTTEQWDYFSFNTLVPWKFINANRKLPWNWKFVFRSPRFAPEFFMTDSGEQEAWDAKNISGYRRMTFGLIEYLERRKYKLDWTLISYCDFCEEKARFYQKYQHRKMRIVNLGLNPNEVKISEIARNRQASAELAEKIRAYYPEATKIICLTLVCDAMLGYICAREGKKQLDLLIIEATSKWEHGYDSYSDSRFIIDDLRGQKLLNELIRSEPFILVSEWALGEYERQEIFGATIPENGCCVSLFD